MRENTLALVCSHRFVRLETDRLGTGQNIETFLGREDVGEQESAGHVWHLVSLDWRLCGYACVKSDYPGMRCKEQCGMVIWWQSFRSWSLINCEGETSQFGGDSRLCEVTYANRIVSTELHVLKQLLGGTR